jgi:hypothetical protein
MDVDRLAISELGLADKTSSVLSSAADLLSDAICCIGDHKMDSKLLASPTLRSSGVGHESAILVKLRCQEAKCFVTETSGLIT